MSDLAVANPVFKDVGNAFNNSVFNAVLVMYLFTLLGVPSVTDERPSVKVFRILEEVNLLIVACKEFGMVS